MAKMLWEVWVKQAIAQAKEDMGANNIWKYMRYYRMFMERYKYIADGVDVTNRIEDLLFWRGKAIIWKSAINGTVILEHLEDKDIKDANGNIVKGVGQDANGVKHTVDFTKDAVLIYADSTRVAPVLYIWAMANEILTVQDIIRQQNNMLRKPILVSGEGAGFDEAMTKVQNVLSGVAWFNYNNRKGKTGGILDEKQPVEVLNLQVGNSYKGIELWDNVKHYEEFICDYLGYTTTKNEKRERMNSLEITNENSIGMTFYKSQTGLREEGVNKATSYGCDIEFKKVLEIQEGGEENGTKEKMDRNNKPE